MSLSFVKKMKGKPITDFDTIGCFIIFDKFEDKELLRSKHEQKPVLFREKDKLDILFEGDSP